VLFFFFYEVIFQLGEMEERGKLGVRKNDVAWEVMEIAVSTGLNNQWHDR